MNRGSRILVLTLVTLVLMVLMIHTTVPVVASMISGTMAVVPSTPNIYRVGDTIHYELAISNPILNTATNTLTRIWDTMPDGAVVEFLGTNETLIQEPGDVDYFYADYVVREVDLIWIPALGGYGVNNKFEAQGYDSNFDSLYVMVTKNSMVIRPAIDIEKSTNGQDADTPPGPFIEVGAPVSWSYVVTNPGDSPLSNITVTDSEPGVAPVYVTGDDGDNVLQTTETWVYEVNGEAVAGQYMNDSTATGTPPVGDPVYDSDPSYYFGDIGCIDIEKYIYGQDADSPTGPYIPVGQGVNWTYSVTNCGSLDLTNIVITDDSGTPGNLGDDWHPVYVAGDDGDNTLQIGETWIYWATGSAGAGQYANDATATGTPPVGDPVLDSDPAYYFGSNPSIDLEKYVWDGATWQDADAAPGPSLTPAHNPVPFRFVIANIGGVDLISVNLSDTDMSLYNDQACTTPATFPITLAVSETKFYYGRLLWVEGQHSNTATATGTPSVGAPVFDSDPAHYFGSQELPQPTTTIYELTISSATGGSVATPGEGTFTYEAGTVVNLVASPASGYQFVNWTGDVSTIANVNAATTTITMNDNYSIRANFEVIPAAQYTLMVSHSTGGSVTSPGEGPFTYDAGIVVDLVATPASGYQFVGWSWCAATVVDVDAGSTTITMNGNYWILANFEPIPS